MSSISTTPATTNPGFFPTLDTNCVYCLDPIISQPDKEIAVPECRHPAHYKCYKTWITTPKTNHHSLSPAQREKTCSLCRRSIGAVKVFQKLASVDLYLFLKNATHSTTPVVTLTPPPILSSPTMPVSTQASIYGNGFAQGYGLHRDPTIYVDIRGLHL